MDLINTAERLSQIRSELEEARFHEAITKENQLERIKTIYSNPVYADLFLIETLKRVRDVESTHPDGVEAVLSRLLKKTLLTEAFERAFAELRNEYKTAREGEYDLGGQSVSIDGIRKKILESSGEQRRTAYSELGQLSEKYLKPLLLRRREITDSMAEEMGYDDSMEMASELLDIKYTKRTSESILYDEQCVNLEDIRHREDALLRGSHFTAEAIMEKARLYSTQAMSINPERMMLYAAEKGTTARIVSKGNISTRVALPLARKTKTNVDNLILSWHEILHGFFAVAERQGMLQRYTGIFDEDLTEAFAAFGEHIAGTIPFLRWYSEGEFRHEDFESFSRILERKKTIWTLWGSLRFLIDMETLYGTSQQHTEDRCRELYSKYLRISNPELEPGIDLLNSWSHTANSITPLSSNVYILPRLFGRQLYDSVRNRYGTNWTNPEHDLSREVWRKLSHYAGFLDSSKNFSELIDGLNYI